MAEKIAVKFYICKHCGNIVGMIFDSGVVPVCCGDKMTELVANTTDAAKEKHVPVITVSGNEVHVVVGAVAHPMEPEHFIQWIYLETEQGGQRKSLKPGDKPEAVFALAEGDKLIAAYAYCNKHGLWKAGA
jgi:superoxide reductase